MDFETEKIKMSQIIGKEVRKFSIEDSVIIPDSKPDILSTIGLNGNIYIHKKELINDIYKVDGGLQLGIMYLADDQNNSITALNTTIDFRENFVLEGIIKDSFVSSKLEIKNIECQILNGRKLALKVHIEVEIEQSNNSDNNIIKAIKNSEDIQFVDRQLNVFSVNGRAETMATAKDTLMVGDEILDIAMTDVVVKNKDVKISYNKILTKADVAVEITYITAQGKIASLETMIPIMGFIDVPGISDKDICQTKYEMKNLNIKNNLEDRSLYIEVEYFIFCTTYVSKELNIIEDLYSTDFELEINKNKLGLIQNKAIIKSDYDFYERANIEDLHGATLYKLNIFPRVCKSQILNNEVAYECEVVAQMLYYSTVTNKIELREQSLPFNYSLSSEEIYKNSNISTDIEVKEKSYEITDNDELILKVKMQFVADISKVEDTEIVTGIQVKNELDLASRSSLVIYYIKDGDNLWNIAKKFKSTKEKIVELNEMDESVELIVGEKLFIPG